VEGRKGGARSRHATAGWALSQLRLQIARRVHHARARRGGTRIRAVRSPSPLVPGRVLSARGGVNRGERRALRHYRLRGYRLLEANARVGRYELDLVLRRGRTVVVVEVKEKSGEAFGHPLEMID